MTAFLFHILISIWFQCFEFWPFWCIMIPFLYFNGLMIYDIKLLVICVFAIHIFSFLWYWLSFSLHFFKWIISLLVFLLLSWRVLCIFWVTVLYQICLLHVFLICDLTSPSLDYVVQSNLFEIFNGLKFIHSFFHESCLWCFILKVITILKVI